MPDSDSPKAHSDPSSRDHRGHNFDSSCIFCLITSTYAPVSPKSSTTELDRILDPDKLSPPAFVLLSTEHVVAFLDIAPLTRGHVLVVPRGHWRRVGDLPGRMGGELGRLLPLLSRSLMRSVLPDIPLMDCDYNVVQNNGTGAAQVIPHVHFHIIPRPPLDYKPPSTASTGTSQKYPPSKLPTGIQASYIQFGRGMRNELDEEDAGELVRKLREEIAKEWTKEMEVDVKGKL